MIDDGLTGQVRSPPSRVQTPRPAERRQATARLFFITRQLLLHASRPERRPQDDQQQQLTRRPTHRSVNPGSTNTQRVQFRRKGADGRQTPAIAVREALQNGARVGRDRGRCALQDTKCAEKSRPRRICSKCAQWDRLEPRVEPDGQKIPRECPGICE